MLTLCDRFVVASVDRRICHGAECIPTTAVRLRSRSGPRSMNNGEGGDNCRTCPPPAEVFSSQTSGSGCAKMGDGM